MKIPVVEVKELTKQFDSKEVLKGVSFNLFSGEIFVLLGPNGAGKTTTVKVLSGVLPPSSGEVYILGEKMGINNTEIKRHIGYLPDEPYIYTKLTGEEFIEFILSVYKINIDLQLYKFLISKFELQEVINQQIEFYSKGMKQKLLLTSIFLRQPEIYILDEPLVGLDPVSISFFKQYIKQLAKQGKTIILCTHLIDLAEYLATKIAIIYNGKILISGSKTEIISQLNLKTDKLEEIYLHLTSQV
ncbi:MAG: ABC transporter ATP-binding protein [Endomicrobia bacterium]|nr:ABC transporter ATP-binding protein [Endomicrobiia bacterium]